MSHVDNILWNNIIPTVCENFVTSPRSRSKRRRGSESSRQPRRRRHRRGARVETSQKTSSPLPPELWVSLNLVLSPISFLTSFSMLVVHSWVLTIIKLVFPRTLLGVSLDGIYLPPNQMIQTGWFIWHILGSGKAFYKTKICCLFQATHQDAGDVERVFGSFHKAHQGGLIHNTYR